MEVSQLPASVILFIVSSILPAIIAFVILMVVARGRATHLWLVPGGLAAAAIAPVLATFLGIPLLISTFQAMATNGGGIGARSDRERTRLNLSHSLISFVGFWLEKKKYL